MRRAHGVLLVVAYGIGFVGHGVRLCSDDESQDAGACRVSPVLLVKLPALGPLALVSRVMRSDVRGLTALLLTRGARYGVMVERVADAVKAPCAGSCGA